jgi:hypothetical protein
MWGARRLPGVEADAGKAASSRPPRLHTDGKAEFVRRTIALGLAEAPVDDRDQNSQLRSARKVETIAVINASKNDSEALARRAPGLLGGVP